MKLELLFFDFHSFQTIFCKVTHVLEDVTIPTVKLAKKSRHSRIMKHKSKDNLYFNLKLCVIMLYVLLSVLDYFGNAFGIFEIHS